MAGARFVDPKILARIGNLELLARTVVDGFINGLHRAPYFGASIDFAEHRGYVAGDDIRRVDWRLFARTDRYYVKQYEADTNTNFSRAARHLEVDGVREPRRLEARIRPLSRAPAWPTWRTASATASASSPSTTTSSRTCRRRRSTSTCVLHTLDRAQGRASAASWRRRCSKMAEHFKRRSILVLISDFYEEPDVILEAIKPLRFLGNDLIVFHVLDPAEIDFDYDDASSFEDLESGEQMPVVPESFGERVPEADAASTSTRSTTKFSEHRIDYTLLNTVEPLDHALFSYLSSRERLMQGRCSGSTGRSLTSHVIPAPLFLARPRRDRRFRSSIHLIQRERKRVVEFPSLMFVRRIPYQSVRRRRIRHWFLLLMRAAAIALIVAAFARPFLPQSARGGRAPAAARARSSILLDQSASMGYGDHWQQRAATRRDSVDRRPRRRRPRDARAVRPERRRERARDRRIAAGSKRRSTPPRSPPARRATARR